jgi:hypothetical protein
VVELAAAQLRADVPVVDPCRLRRRAESARAKMLAVVQARAISLPPSFHVPVVRRTQSGFASGCIRAPPNILLEHDLFQKPVPTFRDHALAGSARSASA